VAASAEELAFDLALDSLDLQRDVLKDVRARATTLLTASSLVTSFVGGRAIDAAGLDPFTGAAIVAFFLTLVPAIHLLTGSGEARFSIEGARLYSDLTLAEASLEEAYAALADDIHEARRRNRPLVKQALWSLRVGFGALIVEVILFLTALAVH
jgi:hypothetical protein